jgi:hypothetical protein
VSSSTLLDGAGEGPAARKEWVMDTHTIRRTQGMRAGVIAVLLAVTIAAGVLAVQVASIWSTTTRSPVQPVGSGFSGQQYGGTTSSDHIRVGRVGAVPQVGR